MHEFQQSFAFAHIEPVQYNIAVLNHIVFALLPVLALRLHGVFGAEFHKIGVLHNFCADEAFLKIGMDDSCGLGGLAEFTNCPAAHLIMASGEEVDEV